LDKGLRKKDSLKERKNNMEALLDFLRMQDANIRFVVLGSVLLGISSALVGSFLVVRKEGLVGDAVAHSVLPGIAVAFLWTGQKNIWIMLLGASLTGLLALACIQLITRYSKIKQDAAIALVLSVFFGGGMVLLTYIQQQGMGGQSGLDQFLFGKAAALIGQDVWVFSGLAILIIGLVLFSFRGMVTISFDAQYAQLIGFPVKGLQYLLICMTMLAVITGITAVGVVLMAAMLITPAAAARYWTHRMSTLMILAACIGGFSGWAGALISYLAPGMPTGPWMVIVASCIAAASLLFAPRKGLIVRYYHHRKMQGQMSEENFVKEAYHLSHSQLDQNINVKLLQERLQWSAAHFARVLKRMKRKHHVEQHQQGHILTDEGLKLALEVVRRHRLWEMYLNKYLKLPEDHLHMDAEAMEHVLTPYLEDLLAEQLGHPEHDPHQKPIPPAQNQRVKRRKEDHS
jgi:manganese/zinc/iron transport system permease protein